MKNKISKKYLLISVSVLLIFVSGIIWACAGGDDFADFYNSFFAPEVSQTPEAAPFYRSGQTFYGGESYHDAVAIFDSVNIDEWRHFFSDKVTKKDLEFLVYQSRIGEIDSLIFFIKNASYPLPQALKQNSILALDDKALTKEVLFYLGFAKRCEPYATYNPGWWSDNEKDPRDNSAGMDKLVAGGKKAVMNIKSDFIRERYHFQIIRMLYNEGLTSECTDYYEQHKEAFKTGNTIQYRALGYVAACFHFQKNYSEANYLYAVLFDKCPTMRQTAFLSFHPQEETDWEGSLALAKTQHEKETLWHLLGIYVDPLRAMKQIYTLNPKSDLLNLLLVRAVNIDEEQFIPNAANYWEHKDSSYRLKSQKTDHDLLDFVKKVADAGNTQKAYLWNLSAGYLCLASGDYPLAGKYFDKAGKESGNNALVNEQIRALRVMSKIETYKTPDNKSEDELTGELNWFAKDTHQPALRNTYIYSWALSRLSEKYRAWGDSVKAQCLDHEQNRHYYDNDQNMSALIALMDKPHKSRFEQYILEVHPYHRADLFDYRAIGLIYQYKFKEALAMFDGEKGSGDKELAADPFVIHINDCHDCDFLAEKKETYTKYTFVKKLLSLQERAVSDPKKASEYYFLLANGLYNMTYFGNARDVYASPVNEYMSSGYVDFQYDREKLNGLIFDCSKAMEYYQKAMDATSDKEFKAKCCFMAAKCEQNNYYNSSAFSYERAIQSGIYFRKLKTDFSKTGYYKEIIHECGYFRTFLEL
jgi:hypothetical protein